MLVGYKRAQCKKVLVINRKGGAGKSTFAIAMASFYAHQNVKTEIIDLDPQGTSYFWGSKNEGVRTTKFLPSSNIPFSLALRLKADTRITVIDSPSNFSQFEMEKYISMVDKIVFPVQPSPIDVHSMLGFIKDLIKSPAFKNNGVELAFVITRCKENNQGTEFVHKVLQHMKYPLLGTMSESQAYQNMFSEKNSFLISHPELDKELWQNMKQWLDVDMTPPQTPDPEEKQVAEPKSATYRSLLNKRY
ncbi:ParA family protein [Aliivibrio sp. S3MY1]|uniref:ParA family protein n=1 Tax=unclassified Aliivibrio TaxID=2645654 RepID=UPI002378C4C4|nr:MULTISPECIES: ParA family protein [unclassified Aliivibrio]MDD9195314.1 ParA family protein [Aliivibrio sp. S3MY1]MDD9198913.1 ParA family protein [Aliivibrio sp. S2MY1]